MHRRIAWGTAVLAATLPMASCSASDEPGASEAPKLASASSTSTPSSSASPSDPLSPTGSPATAPGLTPPGTELGLGEPATVALPHGGGEVVIRVTVEAIEAGEAADLEAQDLGDTAGLEPFYVRVTGVLASGNATGLDPAAAVHGLTGGPVAQPLVTIGTFAPCPASHFASGDSRGTVVVSCAVQVAGSEDAVAAVAWAAAGSDYDRFSGSPVVWR